LDSTRYQAVHNAYVRVIPYGTALPCRTPTRACDRSGKWGGAGQKSGGVDVEKTMKREQSAEWEVAEWGAG